MISSVGIQIHRPKPLYVQFHRRACSLVAPFRFSKSVRKHFSTLDRRSLSFFHGARFYRNDPLVGNRKSDRCDRDRGIGHFGVNVTCPKIFLHECLREYL